MRFSCSSPLLSSMIRMLINVSLAVCSNLSISRLITHTPRPFSIIKSLLCGRLVCWWLFVHRYVLTILVHTVGFRVALYNFVFIRVIHESCERILQLRQLFGAFKIAVLLRLVELFYGVKHSIKCIVPEQRLVSCVRIHSSNIVHSRFPCKFSHIILPPEIVLLLLRYWLRQVHSMVDCPPEHRGVNHAPLRCRHGAYLDNFLKRLSMTAKDVHTLSCPRWKPLLSVRPSALTVLSMLRIPLFLSTRQTSF